MVNLLKKLPFWRRYTTEQNKRYWANRKLGWQEYLNTADHPHRHFITNVLRQMNWGSLLEIGCGSGPNLANIAKNISNRQLGGVDINSEAIEIADKTFRGGWFRVGSAEDMMMSDKSSDVILSDAFLIYVGPFKIRKYLKEIRRVARKYVVLCEYHNKSWWKRQRLRVFSGRHAYNYRKLLKKLGFYDIMIINMPPFEEDNEQCYRHLIVACVPKLW